MKCCTDIHGQQRMSLADFGDSPTFHLAKPSGQNLNVVHYLKGYFGFFEVELCEVLIYSQCLTYSKWWSARSQFGESARSPSEQGQQ